MIPMLPHLGQAALTAPRPQQPTRQGLLGQARSVVGGLLGGVQDQFRRGQESDEGFNLLRFRPPPGMNQSEMIMLAGAGLQDLDPLFGGGRMQAAQQMIDQRIQGRQAEEAQRAEMEQMQAFRATLPPEQQAMFDLNPQGFMDQMTRAEFRAPAAVPALLQAYQLAVDQGETRSFNEWDAARRAASRPQTNVNVAAGPSGPQIGTIPQGFQLVQDPDTGAYSMEPIPGGPAAQEAAAEVDQQQRREALTARNVSVVTDEIGRALTTIADNRNQFGRAAIVTGIDPEGPVAEVGRLYDTIGSFITRDTLQQMREASSTGGALGAVSDAENAMLRAAYGSFDPTAPVETQVYNLVRLNNMLMDVVHGPGQGPERMTVEQILPPRGRGRQPAPDRPDPLGLRGGR